MRNTNLKFLLFFCLSLLLFQVGKDNFFPLLLPFLCLMELEINMVLLVYLLHSITGDVSISLGNISVKVFSVLNCH